MPGTTGDIIWRRTDPKTVELYNTDREPKGAGGGEGSGPAISPAEDAMMRAMSGKQISEKERASFVEDQPGEPVDPYAHDKNRKLSPEERKEHKQRLKDFMKYWKSSDPSEFDPTDGIQELLDGGIMWYDKGGWGTYADLHMSPKDRRAFIGAADAWGDRVGIYNPDGTFNPDAARTYWENQQRQMEEYHRVYP